MTDKPTLKQVLRDAGANLDGLKRLEHDLAVPGDARVTGVHVNQKISAQNLAVHSAQSSQREAADRLSKLGDSLQAHWKEICKESIGSSERIASLLAEAESTFKSSLIVLERAQGLIRDEEETITRVVNEGREKAKRIVERCDAIERDISGTHPQE